MQSSKTTVHYTTQSDNVIKIRGPELITLSSIQCCYVLFAKKIYFEEVTFYNKVCNNLFVYQTTVTSIN